MQLPATSTFPARLKYLRVLRGFTQADLADRLSFPIHVQTVAKWETGRTEPRRHRLAAIAKALGTSLAWLATGKGKRPE